MVIQLTIAIQTPRYAFQAGPAHHMQLGRAEALPSVYRSLSTQDYCEDWPLTRHGSQINSLLALLQQ